MRLYIDKGRRERETRREQKVMQGGGEIITHIWGPEGVIEVDAVIQSSRDAVMKLPPSSILSAWHGQLPAALELSKKLRCISD